MPEIVLSLKAGSCKLLAKKGGKNTVICHASGSLVL